MTEHVEIHQASVVDGELIVKLSDGRRIFTPVVLYERLATASPAQLARLETSPYGVHWEELDEDVGLGSLLSVARLEAPALEASAAPAFASARWHEIQRKSFAIASISIDIQNDNYFPRMKSIADAS